MNPFPITATGWQNWGPSVLLPNYQGTAYAAPPNQFTNLGWGAPGSSSHSANPQQTHPWDEQGHAPKLFYGYRALFERNLSKKDKTRPIFTEPPKFVTVIVGLAPHEKTFTIPKNLMVHCSPFFKAAFEGKFEEGKTQQLTLDDVESEVFGLFTHWIYSGEILVKGVSNEGDDAITQSTLDSNIMPLAKLWFLADRFLMPSLQNEVMETLLLIFSSDTTDAILPFTLHTYEEGTSHGDNPMKMLSRYLLSEQTDQADLLAWKERLPQELLFDLALEFNERCRNPEKKALDFEVDLFVTDDTVGKNMHRHYTKARFGYSTLCEEPQQRPRRSCPDPQCSGKDDNGFCHKCGAEWK